MPEAGRTTTPMNDSIFQGTDELAISRRGLCCASALSRMAVRDRSLSARSLRLLPLGLQRILRSTHGIAGHLTPPRPYVRQSILICRAPAWRLGVLRLGPNASVPLHDHPGAYAVSRVLTGTVRMEAFSCAGNKAIGTADLRRAWRAELGPDQSAVLDPWDINVHRLRASDKGAVLLTGAFSNGKRLARRRWFFALQTPHEDRIRASVLEPRQRGVLEGQPA